MRRLYRTPKAFARTAPRLSGEKQTEQFLQKIPNEAKIALPSNAQNRSLPSFPSVKNRKRQQHTIVRRAELAPSTARIRPTAAQVCLARVDRSPSANRP